MGGFSLAPGTKPRPVRKALAGAKELSASAVVTAANLAVICITAGLLEPFFSFESVASYEYDYDYE